MSIHLRLRIVLAALLGALLVISLGAALEFREIALFATELLGPDARPLAAEQAAATIASQATTAAVGLALVGVLALALGAAVFRTIGRSLLRRLTALDRAAADIERGDGARRAALDGDDELARIARTLNFVLDLRDRSDAEMRGRNREIRALLVALLREWPRPIALTGIDGEVLASTLMAAQDQRFRSLTPQVREAANVLLSRGFVSAAELETDVNFADGVVVHVRALALSERRIVGWLAEFDERGPHGRSGHDGGARTGPSSPAPNERPPSR